MLLIQRNPCTNLQPSQADRTQAELISRLKGLKGLHLQPYPCPDFEVKGDKKSVGNKTTKKSEEFKKVDQSESAPPSHSGISKMMPVHIQFTVHEARHSQAQEKMGCNSIRDLLKASCEEHARPSLHVGNPEQWCFERRKRDISLAKDRVNRYRETLSRRKQK